MKKLKILITSLLVFFLPILLGLYLYEFSKFGYFDNDVLESGMLVYAILAFILGLALTYFFKIQKPVFTILAPIFLTLGTWILVFILTSDFFSTYMVYGTIVCLIGVGLVWLGYEWIKNYHTPREKKTIFGFSIFFNIFLGLIFYSIFVLGNGSFVKQNNIQIVDIPSDYLNITRVKNYENINSQLNGLFALSKDGTNSNGLYYQIFTGENGRKYLNPQDFEIFYAKNKNYFSALETTTQPLINALPNLSGNIYFPNLYEDEYDKTILGRQQIIRNLIALSYANFGKNDQKSFEYLETAKILISKFSTSQQGLLDTMITLQSYKEYLTFVDFLSTISNSQQKTKLKTFVLNLDFEKFLSNGYKVERYDIQQYIAKIKAGVIQNFNFFEYLFFSNKYFFDLDETEKLLDMNFASKVCDIQKTFGKSCNYNYDFAKYLDETENFNFEKNWVGENLLKSFLPRNFSLNQYLELKNLENKILNS